MVPGPIGPVPIDAETFHTHGSPVDAETIRIHKSPVGIRNVHVHGSMKAGVRIPPRSSSPVMQPWIL